MGDYWAQYVEMMVKRYREGGTAALLPMLQGGLQEIARSGSVEYSQEVAGALLAVIEAVGEADDTRRGGGAKEQEVSDGA